MCFFKKIPTNDINNVQNINEYKRSIAGTKQMSTKENAILKEFILESSEGLASVSQELTQFEKEGFANSELINSIYRTVHTLKGSACFLAFKNLEALAHSTETVLDYLREGTLKPSSNMIDLLLSSFDRCEDILKHISSQEQEPEEKNDKLIQKLESLLEHELLGEVSVKEDNIINFHGDIQDETNAEEVLTAEPESSSASSIVVDVEKMLEGTEKIVEINSPVAAVKEDQNSEQQAGQPIQGADSTVRVSVNLLDKILNVVGELVLNRNQILQLSKEREEPDLTRLSHQLNVITTELQTDIMTTRMQPVGNVFTKFERMVRDLARSQAKNIKLDIQGQETELDKTLLEFIKDPLTHIIRNCVDHGIEAPLERQEKGKSEAGHLSIKTYHAGGQVIIDITDDGKGINTAKILEKAMSKGIITQEEAATMPAQKAMNLIFHPGLSTAESVTNISGRGVGMDVVKSNIEKIGGQCDIQSTLDVGTTFK